MRTLLPLALCAVLLVGCGKDAKTTARVDEMQAKVDALNQRVKALEDDVLAARKELVQEQQAMQRVNDRMRDMDNYFNKLQIAQTTTSR
jgi:outer membrane murein-binding lipoprotein Lpp